MKTNNVNGQNGVATSANVNANGYYNVDVLANRSANHISKRAVDNINVCGKHFIDYSMVYDDGKRIKVIGCVKIAEGYNTFYVADDAKYSFVCNIIKEEKKGRRYVEVDNVVVKVDDLSFADLQKSLYNAVNEKFILLADEQVAEQEQENEQEWDDAAIEYLREVMPVVDVQMIKEKIVESVEDLCIVEDDKSMDFDEFCDVLWNDYVWDEVFTDEALESETRDYMEFNDRVRYIIDNDIDNIFVTYDGCVEASEVYNAPILDDDVDRVVNTIEKYLGSYTPSYLDSFGECVITIGWDEFSEKDMQMLIEDDVFEGLVIDSLVGENISDVLVYDDGVYVTVDYDKMFDKSNVLNTLRREYALCDVDEYEMPINTLADLCGGYHVNAPIYVMYNKESDTYYVNGLGEDNDFAINEELTSKTTYMELYDMITELLENENDIIEYIYNLDSRPSWVTKNDIKIANSYNGEYLDIVMFGSYHVGLYYNDFESVHDFAKADYSGAYDIEDMRYAIEIMENRDYIVPLAKKVLVDCEFNKVA